MDSNSLANDGIILLNGEKGGGAEKTVIVLGVARSGTSMVARVLSELGVYMGAEIDDVILEDSQIRKVLEEEEDLNAFDRLVEERNAAHEIWGWKIPETRFYLDRILPGLRNPHFVIIFRDYIAIAKRALVSAHHDKRQYIIGLNRVQYRELVDLVAETSLPSLLLSYEKVILHRQHFIGRLVQFLNIAPSDREVSLAESAIVPESRSYIRKTMLENSDKTAFTGKIEGIEDGILWGWAIRNNDPGTHVHVEIIVNGILLETVSADQFHEKVKFLGYGDGTHAFRFSLKGQADESEIREIRAQIKDTEYELRNSPYDPGMKEGPDSRWD